MKPETSSHAADAATLSRGKRERLIAAAPEMLDALRVLVDFVDDTPTNLTEDRRLAPARALLARIDGEGPTDAD